MVSFHFLTKPIFLLFLKIFHQKIQLEVLYNSTVSNSQKSIILHDFGGTFCEG